MVKVEINGDKSKVVMGKGTTIEILSECTKINWYIWAIADCF
jgi:hypothetical protein